MELIRVHIPRVRPFVRCTLRRALRLMPSFLLLLFVFSLIFVTLMQIAVIHVHRRGHLGLIPTRHDGNFSSFMPSVGAPAPLPTRRTETFRVEALIDRTAPSVELNIRRFQALANTARLKKIHQVLDVGHACSSTPSTSPQMCQNLPLCDAIPKNLVGRVPVRLQGRNCLTPRCLNVTGVAPGSTWRPAQCRARQRVAVVIPYRDRRDHLAVLLATLHPILRRQMLEYRVYVVEQLGNDTFNKGVLMNAGVKEALKDHDFQCFVFHDVDLLPEDDRNYYSCTDSPRHMSVAVDKFNYTLPYSLLIGGVFSIRTDQLLLVNGYSNLYWGWGGEDDDMAYRLKYRKLNILRPPESVARYTMIKHNHRPESPDYIRTALLRMAKRRSPRDGLNTVKYKLVSLQEHPLYTHLLIDIGHHHRWQFVRGQRVIINF